MLGMSGCREGGCGNRGGEGLGLPVAGSRGVDVHTADGRTVAVFLEDSHVLTTLSCPSVSRQKTIMCFMKACFPESGGREGGSGILRSLLGGTVGKRGGWWSPCFTSAGDAEPENGRGGCEGETRASARPTDGHPAPWGFSDAAHPGALSSGEPRALSRGPPPGA